ncbi:fructose- -bisphosphatase [Chrysochromulina tobinii]|uniref:Fructose--bisphosphatase n=1 Tax=Chrysochromulina tobinii TaxID=1460289 RepID=A0A0M0JF64_9EUKA|nr:fructose- -bisphosphatase [Chrysochromulina tobinii]|eukprot:KOO25241.1 fructose- -bisphosphatase [Chrysochromulina sp. CCMP291]
MTYSNPVTDDEAVSERIVIAMVGLPARGKSFISKAILRYLIFLGVACKLFNAGNKRRDKGKAGADASFFDPNNKSAQEQKEQMAMETLTDMLNWLSAQRGLACGLFDATNTTVARRRAVIERCAKATPAVTLIFLESECNDESILRANYELKLTNDDYKKATTDAERQAARDDFMGRVHAYEKVYEPISDAEADAIDATPELPPLRYMKIVDAGKKVVVSRCDGDSFVCRWVVQLMHSIHLSPRRVHIVLCGQSCNDAEQIRGGDSRLSEAGLTFGKAAVETLMSRLDTTREPPVVMTGTLLRYGQMAEILREAILSFERKTEKKKREEAEKKKAMPARVRRTVTFGPGPLGMVFDHVVGHATILKVDGYVTIFNVSPGSQAEHQGVVVGSKVVSVAGEPMEGVSRPAVMARIKEEMQRAAEKPMVLELELPSVEEAARTAAVVAEAEAVKKTAEENAAASTASSIPSRSSLRSRARNLPVHESRNLNELCFGSLEGLQGGRLRDFFPEEYELREADRLNYRYPGVGGQSYYDLIVQIRAVLLTIEASRRDAVVVCDLAVARVLLGYFQGHPIAGIPDLDVPPGVVELSRTHAGFSRTDFPVHVGLASMLANLR